jgi:hypothetical protein
MKPEDDPMMYMIWRWPQEYEMVMLRAVGRIDKEEALFV